MHDGGDRTMTTSASTGTPPPTMRGGEVGERRRRLDAQAAVVAIAVDWTRKLEDSVAMIGGMRRRRISA